MKTEWMEMFFKQWEKMFTTFTEQLLKNQQFLTHMGKMIESSSLFKLAVDKAVVKGLEAMQLPTRKDVEEVLAVLRKLEISAEKGRIDREDLRRTLEGMSVAMVSIGKAVELLHPAPEATPVPSAPAKKPAAKKKPVARKRTVSKNKAAAKKKPAAK